MHLYHSRNYTRNQETILFDQRTKEALLKQQVQALAHYNQQKALKVEGLATLNSLRKSAELPSKEATSTPKGAANVHGLVASLRNIQKLKKLG